MPKEFDAPVRVLDVAQSIGSGLAKAALGGIVDGKMVDASFVIDKDSHLAIITDKSPEAPRLFVIPQRTCWPTPLKNSFQKRKSLLGL